MIPTLWMMATVAAFALGANDGANPTAAAVGAGLLRPRGARILAALAGGTGAWLAGDRVAGTLARELVPFHALASQEAQELAVVALAAASLWVLAATAMGLPVSTSHALVGALTGAALREGAAPVDLGVLGAIAGSWIWVPVGAAGAGALAALAGRLPGTRRVQGALAPLVRACSAWIAFWWGANDVANAVALAAQVGGAGWAPAMVLGAACLAAGAYWGSGRVLATMASGLGPVGAPEALAVQGSVALALAAATLMGYPVSTTHAVVSALAGVLRARGKPVNVRQVARVAAAWLLTAPAAGLLGWLLGGI
ncbi:inorganic phosphate transporter [Limnochorda pilosa]|uniref:Sodium:phosphate symporter n=1 Tax=Limnochorda pilosa TaxID=1555112 RepID=A0A0K2SI37_LIMPI|nr:inorganic phosphate transporter [Limnochorda pilosa]BAS26677.1 sodium:phosphate symporter [Limnochorda pilosa]